MYGAPHTASNHSDSHRNESAHTHSFTLFSLFPFPFGTFAYSLVCSFALYFSCICVRTVCVWASVYVCVGFVFIPHRLLLPWFSVTRLSLITKQHISNNTVFSSAQTPFGCQKLRVWILPISKATAKSLSLVSSRRLFGKTCVNPLIPAAKNRYHLKLSGSFLAHTVNNSV